MSSDLSEIKATVGATVAEQRLPNPPIDELRPTTGFLAESRVHLASAIRGLPAASSRSLQEVTELIHKRYAEIANELQRKHQHGELRLFDDSDGTDRGLQHLRAGSLQVQDIEAGITPLQGGRIVGRAEDLAKLAQDFFDKHGYPMPPPAGVAVPTESPGAKSIPSAPERASRETSRGDDIGTKIQAVIGAAQIYWPDTSPITPGKMAEQLLKPPKNKRHPLPYKHGTVKKILEGSYPPMRQRGILSPYTGKNT